MCLPDSVIVLDHFNYSQWQVGDRTLISSGNKIFFIKNNF